EEEVDEGTDEGAQHRQLGEEEAQKESRGQGDQEGREDFPAGDGEARAHFRPRGQPYEGVHDGGGRGSGGRIDPAQPSPHPPEREEAEDGGGDDQALVPPHGPRAWSERSARS